MKLWQIVVLVILIGMPLMILIEFVPKLNGSQQALGEYFEEEFNIFSFDCNKPIFIKDLADNNRIEVVMPQIDCEFYAVDDGNTVEIIEQCFRYVEANIEFWWIETEKGWIPSEIIEVFVEDKGNRKVLFKTEFLSEKPNLAIKDITFDCNMGDTK